VIRVVLADDHPVFAQGLRAVLEAEADVRVVAVAGTGRAAVDAATAAVPDVAVLDIAMPDGDGLWATARLREAGLPIRVLVLTMSDDAESVFAALRAGASGYTVKGAGPDEVVAAVRAVARGEVIFGQGVAARMLHHVTRVATTGPFPQLTEREHEVLDLLARGFDNPAVARRLALSGKTVRNHVSNVIAKLQVVDRTAAIIRARDAGLGGPPGRS
jgi:DNA-binding NarL/FixJ family response regulator